VAHLAEQHAELLGPRRPEAERKALELQAEAQQQPLKPLGQQKRGADQRGVPQ
jgi:hypothetical protein